MISSVLPSPYFKSYANLASPVVMSTDDPLGKGRKCCRVYVGGAGTLVVRPRNGASDGSDDETITSTAGKDFDLECDQIVSGTATVLTVFWPRV